MKLQNGWRSGEVQMKLEKKHLGAFVLANVRLRPLFQLAQVLVL